MKSNKGKAVQWIDVSVPLRSDMVTWPGDVAVVVEKKLDMKKGDRVTLSAMSMGLHTGTHMDAPMHFIKNGVSLDELPFDATVGTARVIGIKDKESIKVGELEKYRIRKGERILFKTRNSDAMWHQEKFKENFVYISQDAARYLVHKGVRTVGIDYLSVGGFHVDGQETHEALLGAGIWLIEGLDLSKIKAGRHQLICLPLKAFNSEGAPARVILKAKNR